MSDYLECSSNCKTKKCIFLIVFVTSLISLKIIYLPITYIYSIQIKKYELIDNFDLKVLFFILVEYFCLCCINDCL